MLVFLKLVLFFGPTNTIVIF
uniref:Uncharacterized protein n=1 Tax=Rhizophora mucronata TaxID=61149 RepID=A0A2P2QGD7_RHIMU